MSELDRKIRTKLEDFVENALNPQAAAAACLDVLDLHQPESVGYIDRDGQERSSDDCEVCGGNGSPDSYPCPTVLTIAKGLGLLDDEEDET